MPEEIHSLSFNQPTMQENSNYYSKKDMTDYNSLLMSMGNEGTAANEPS